MPEAGDCADCAVKHLAAACVIGREILAGCPERQHLLYWLGHLVEAEEQLLGADPELARAIRALRRAAVDSGLKSRLAVEKVQRLETLAQAVAAKTELGLYRRRCDCGRPVDVLIPLREGGSRHGDAELALAVRSIRLFLSGVRRIVVAGAAPPENLPHGAEFFCVPDVYNRKQMNIHHALCAAMRGAGLAGPVLFWADDNVLLRKATAAGLPTAVRADGLEKYAGRSDTVWVRSLADTGTALAARGKKTLNFEAHTPVRFDCEKYLALDRLYDFYTGVGLRS
ncbi:MAG: hypothetical protein PHI35_09010, partial [Victivallaceae bacterium]|nr:hypothetical protein [Victivallaceae bacterium]